MQNLVIAHGRIIAEGDRGYRALHRFSIACGFKFESDCDEGDDDGEVDEKAEEFVSFEVGKNERFFCRDDGDVADETDADDEGGRGGKHQQNREIDKGPMNDPLDEDELLDGFDIQKGCARDEHQEHDAPESEPNAIQRALRAEVEVGVDEIVEEVAAEHLVHGRVIGVAAASSAAIRPKPTAEEIAKRLPLVHIEEIDSRPVGAETEERSERGAGRSRLPGFNHFVQFSQVSRLRDAQLEPEITAELAAGVLEQLECGRHLRFFVGKFHPNKLLPDEMLKMREATVDDGGVFWLFALGAIRYGSRNET